MLRSPLPAGRALAAASLTLLLAAGCADDGRELAEPGPDQTTTTRPAPTTVAPAQEVSESGLALSSPDFEPGASAPPSALCTGANRHPALSWAGVPDGTAELAVTLSDQTNPAEPVLVWLVAGIDPTTTGLAAGELPAGAVETTNDYGTTGWGSPCLEDLGGERQLQFRLHALVSPSGLTTGFPGNEAWDQVEAGAIDDATVLMVVPAST